MTLLVVLGSAALAAIAAAGVLRPFGGRERVVLERLADPLEDERVTLLRTLRELADERARGSLGEDDYRALRRESELRAVTVIRALEARDGDAVEGVRALRPVPPAPAERRPSASNRRAQMTPALLIGGLLLVVTVPLLVRAVVPRSAGQAITGSVGGLTRAGLSLRSLEQRVRNNPNDAAARLDLAQAYVNAGLGGPAASEYGAALRIDPRNVQALTGLASLLQEAGRPSEALTAADRALAVDPSYPEALYLRGVILLRSMHRPPAAAAALSAYLRAAPFGSHRAEVERLLAGIGGQGAPTTSRAPSPSPSPSG